jgi:glycosyltransferase EpsH
MYHHRKSDASTTGGHNAHLDRGWVRLHTLMSAAIETGRLGEDFRRALDNRIALGLVGQSLNELRSPRRHRQKVAALKSTISSARYRATIGALPLSYLPLHWRIFFAAARAGHAATVLLLARIIDRLR